MGCVAEERSGRPWARGRLVHIMELLAFLGRHGHQDADGLARNRSVRWLVELSVGVTDLLQVETEAMRSARDSAGS